MSKKVARFPVMDTATLLQTCLILFAVVAVVGVGLAIVARMRRSLQNPEQTDKPETLAESFRQALQDGEITEAEYDRITTKLGLKKPTKPSDIIAAPMNPPG